ncbi:class I adenylate-forming enzyme family protein [Lysinibacillus sp. 54212]|uniref:class I adenylate-forming enzyme family protein n=1 Tax=Lysinibacillus sp. 54212 TaxID=3119829 RepID=UPI002FC9E534
MAFNIGQMLADRARLLGKKEGFVANNVRLTFEEMNGRSNAVAHFLIGKNFKAGDKIAIICKNNADFVTVFFGAAKIGVICVAVNYKLQAKEIATIFNHSKVKAVMYDEDLKNLIEQTKSETAVDYYLSNSSNNGEYLISNIFQLYSAQEPEYKTYDHDPILMIYTSGTSGAPKAAMLSHLNLFSSSVSLSTTITYLESDRFMLVVPMFHIAGFVPLITNIHTGATTILLEDFEPISAWKVIEKERITSMMSVPEMLAALIKALDIMKPNLSTLRTITCGAASVPPQIIVVFKQFGIPVQQVYGITEYTGSLTIWRSEFDDKKIGSKGKAVMYGEVKVVSLETGEELPPYENGEVICSGPQTFLGYYQDEEGTDQVLKDGWYYTGDIGHVDENGFLYLVDRLKDIIVSNGEKIYSAEIEAVLIKHPAVAQVGVVGVPDSYFGEIPRAYIELVPGMIVSQEELIDFCRKDLAAYKVIKEVVFVDRLPKNTVGKLLKEELKKLQPQ